MIILDSLLRNVHSNMILKAKILRQAPVRITRLR
jgi:hypothetical protein